MVRRAMLLLAWSVFGLAVACEPSLDDRAFAIDSSRVLAIRATPAEAPPGGTITLTSLYVDDRGPIAGPFDWAFCEARNPLANLGPVNPVCLQRTSPSFLELGAAPSVTVGLPMDACREFGPDVPAAAAGQPPGRPVDPDATGGYYQPVRLVAGEQVAIGLLRIGCGAVGATPDQLSDLAAHDHPNTNPAIDAISDPKLGALAPEGQGTNLVSPSQALSLRASWAACDPSAPSCTGSEGYAVLDPESHAVVHLREQMRVSWFSTGGTFDDDRTGRDATDPTAYSENGWVAPATAGEVHLWVVLRDDRGGVGWRSFVVDVQ